MKMPPPMLGSPATTGRSLVASGLLLAALSFTASAAAQATTSSTAAEALFDAGRTALEKKDYAAACEKFAGSNKLEPAVGTVLNLAYCNEMQGKLATAWSDYREALYKLPPGDSRAATAKGRLDALQPRLSYLTLRAVGLTKESIVLLDSVAIPVEALGVPVPVDPGPHEVVVRSPGRQTETFTTKVGETEKAELAVSPGEPEAGPASSAPRTPEATPPRSTEQPPAPDQGSSPTIGYVIGGIGAASLATSLITGVMALGKNSTVKDHCQADPSGSGRVCDPTGLAAGDSGKTLALISDITLGVGIVGVGVGGYLILSAGGSHEGPKQASAAFKGVF
jgi:hypothetical protein